MAEPLIVNYFFSGNKYIRVRRGETDFGKTEPGYPAPISNWQWPSGFGKDGIDAALYSGSVCFFFKGKQYIQVTRGITGAVLDGLDHKPEILGPLPISNWKWPNGFGENGIDAAQWSGTVTYFYSGNQYIRVTRNSDTDFGTTDPGYPRSIYGGTGWNNEFNLGVKGALSSGQKYYFFRGTEYLRVSRGFEAAGFIDAGYPRPISDWKWPSGFGAHGIDAALYSGGPLVNPGGTLGGSFNYVLADGGKHITGLVVKIEVDNDIVSPTTDQGFSFQLNCESPMSPSGSGIPTWQQFIFDNHPNDVNIFGWINLWEWSSTGWAETFASGTNGSFVLPAPNTIKAGTVLTIAPVFDSNDEITSCNFSFTDPSGNTSTKNAPMAGAKLAPITSITLNIVGWGNYAVATFTAGQGTITYSATNPLTAQAGAIETGESSNMVYEPLPPVVNISQLFGLAPVAAPAPEISKLRGNRPLPPVTKPDLNRIK